MGSLIRFTLATLIFASVQTRADEPSTPRRDKALRAAHAISRELGHLPFPLNRTNVSVRRGDTQNEYVVALHSESPHALEQLQKWFGDAYDGEPLEHHLRRGGGPWAGPAERENADVEILADFMRSMVGVTRVEHDRDAEGRPRVFVTVRSHRLVRSLRRLWPEGRGIKNVGVEIECEARLDVRERVRRWWASFNMLES